MVFLSCDTLSESVFITRRHGDFFRWSSQSTQRPCSVSEGTEDIETPGNKWLRHNDILFSDIGIFLPTIPGSHFELSFIFFLAQHPLCLQYQLTTLRTPRTHI